jgi:hypothetical protein
MRYSTPFGAIQMLVDTVSVTIGTATTFRMAFDDNLEEFDCVVSAVGVVATSPLSSFTDDDVWAIGRGLVVVGNVAAQLLTRFLSGRVYTWQSWRRRPRDTRSAIIAGSAALPLHEEHRHRTVAASPSNC